MRGAARPRRSWQTSQILTRWRRWRRGPVWSSTSSGPYTLYGRPVIEACVAHGAHYADLTGEIPFVRRMIDEFDRRRRRRRGEDRAGVRVRGAACRSPGPAGRVRPRASASARVSQTVDLEVTMKPPGGHAAPVRRDVGRNLSEHLGAGGRRAGRGAPPIRLRSSQTTRPRRRCDESHRSRSRPGVDPTEQ